MTLKGNKSIHWLLVSLLLATPFMIKADTIKIAAGWARPPYIIPDTHSGFELDLVKQLLTNMGHEADFIYVPYERTISLLVQNKVDMTLTVNAKSGIQKSLLSDVFVVYQNVVISLKKNNLILNSIEDLSIPSLVAFQSASEVLGNQFAVAIAQNKLYLEMADQRRQLELFLQGDVEAIIMDINIFTALSKTLTGNDQRNQVTIHPLFPANRYSAGFKDMLLKKQFNQALIDFIATGKYQKLKRTYNMQEITPNS
jgi:polar amino acid transport system substrate-binding protein